MTAAFAYHLDAASPSVQSGRPHSILKAFRQAGVEIAEFFPLVEVGVWQRKYQKLLNFLLCQRYLLDRDETLLRSFAKQLHAGIKDAPAQFLFSPSTLPLSYLETDLPVTFCADTPFCTMVNYYDAFTRLDRRQIELSEQLEARVVNNASLAVYPTQWAADAAANHYGARPDKIAVIPFGANFGRDNRCEEVWPWIEERAGRTPLRLLFVGREWQRKGGDLVIATAQWLRARGLDVQVDLVGRRVPLRYRRLDFIQEHGLLSPHRPDQIQELTRLYAQAHFLFVPSRAEAFGMVFCEASAFGLPAISTATGGISEVIRQGINGCCLPLDAEPADYGRLIRETFESRERYVAMAQNSFHEFEQRLNWQTFTNSFLKRIAALEPNRRTPRLPVPFTSETSRDKIGDADASASDSSALRVAFVADSYFDPERIEAWSGLPYFMWRAFKKQGLQLSVIHVDSNRHSVRRWLKFGAAKLLGRRTMRDRDEQLLRGCAREIERAVEGRDFDFLICPGTVPIAFARPKVPMAFWVDASFAGMVDFYDSFTRLTPNSVREGHATDQAALDGAALAIYSSEWAAETARQRYRIDPSRVHVIRYGANLENVRSTSEVREIIRRRDQGICQLLFIGVNWKRKGAETAVAALQELGKVGINARLTIIGCQAPAGVRLPANVEVVGFLNKRNETERQQIERYFRESHIFFMPTRAEAYGLVFCEANAYGLPCVAANVGGVSSIIKDGVNGCLLPAEASPAEYARRIGEIWSDKTRYEIFADASRRVYDEGLNWDVAARDVVALMRRTLSAAKTT